MGNSQSNPQGTPPTTPTRLPSQRGTASSMATPQLQVDVSGDNTSTVNAPPPYTELDEEPASPPPPPPRDNSRLAVSASTSNRRASYGPPSVPNVSTANSTRLAPSESSRSRTRSDSAAQQGSENASAPPLPPRNDRRRSQRPQGRTPASRPNPPVGGFRAEMESRAQQGVGTRHARMVMLPPGPGDIVSPIQPPDPMTERPIINAPPRTSTTRAPPPKRRNSVEDPLELLRRYDTVCIVDDSSSMEGPLWFEARDALAGIADVAAQYDIDGVDIHFMNSQLTGKGLRSGAEVKRLFDRITPYGITPTGEKLEELLLDYLLKLEDARTAQAAGDEMAVKRIKPVNFLVITDGEATDDPEPVIVQAARRLDDGRFPLSQVGIQFVQIGNDQAASEALRMLDDDLASAYGVRDMVDTVPYTAEGSQLTSDTLSKILLGGINRRQDRRKTSIG